MKRALNIVSFISVIFFSCKKSDNNTIPSLILSGTFQSSNTVSISPVTMYLHNSVITDSTIIAPYLRRQYAFNYYEWGNSSTINVSDTILKINFWGNDSVTYISNKHLFLQPRTLMKAKITTETNGNLLFTNCDSIAGPIQYPPQNNYRCDSIGSFVFQSPKPYSYLIFGTASATRVWKYTFNLHKENEQLFLDRLTCCFNTSYNYSGLGSGYCYSCFENMWVVKKDDIQTKLLPGDTVVVQPSKVAMIKTN